MMIRSAHGGEFDRIWPIFSDIVATGDALAFDAGCSFEEANAYWMGAGVRTYVAEHDGAIVGSYYLKANQPGLGAHVANAGFIVSPEAHGRGVGRSMGQHCLREARALGYRAMQFNFVVSTNERAVALWKSLGFAIIATVPAAFKHASQGLVAAHIMYQSFDDQPNKHLAERR